jgi:hypothetical protein
VCSELILYPPRGLINANVLIYYNYREYKRNTNFYVFRLVGGLKCRGYFSKANGFLELPFNPGLISNPLINQILCFWSDPNNVHQDFTSRFQNDKFCWNGSLSFNGEPYMLSILMYVLIQDNVSHNIEFMMHYLTAFLEAMSRWFRREVIVPDMLDDIVFNATMINTSVSHQTDWEQGFPNVRTATIRVGMAMVFLFKRIFYVTKISLRVVTE